MNAIKVKNFHIGKGHPLCVISGPCVIESEELALSTAEFLKNLCESLNIHFIYKSSYDKANRLSHDSFRGPGLEKGLKILEKVKKRFNVPIFTDIHSPEQAGIAAEVCDVLQIPAFLCRQTDLVMAAALTGKTVNLKKGQFMAPWDMANIVEKVRACDNQNILLTERGTSFGYNNLVSDMRSIQIMKEYAPVCFDASHSVQLPGGRGKSTGGQREFIPTLINAAIASGCHCLYIEAHPNPAEAKSDKESQWPLHELKNILITAKALYEVINGVQV
ncbi:MAG: 3-deoxy-8-phosphooctulonate synthase [Chlamydiae bacterium]|nr:3-deoxy-8-phosphooctulonate synthase [Chlamydiota bacterium]